MIIIADLRLSTASPPTQSTISVVCGGLTYPPHTYYRLNLYTSSGTFLTTLNSSVGGGSTGNFYSVAYTHSGLSAGTTYGYYVNAQYLSSSAVTRIPASSFFYASTLSAPVTPPPVSDDHGNSTGSATTISMSSSGGYRSGSIETNGDVDYFRFTPTVSTNYRMYTTGSLDTQGTLYNSSGSQLTYDDDSGGSGQFRFEYSLSSGSTYYIKVNAYSSNTGSYTLYIDALAPPDDHGNSISSATTIPLSNDSGFLTGQIESSGDVDYFRFTTGSSGASKYHIYTTSSIDTIGYLYNSSGGQLAYNDDNSSMGGGSNFGFEVNLSASTTYYIAVSAYSSGTGSYKIYVSKKDDHSDTSTNATVLTENVGMAGRVEYAGDIDYFKITAPSTDTYEFYTTGSLDTQGTLYDSAFTQLAYNDDNADLGGARNFGLEYALLRSSTYYIKLNAYSTNVGDYTIYFRKKIVAPPAVLNHTISSITGDSFRINLTGGSGSDNFVIEVRKDSSTGAFAYTNYSVAKTATYIDVNTGLGEYIDYHVKVYGSNSAGNGTPSSSMTKTLDTTNPTVTITSTNGVGTMNMQFNPADVTPSGGRQSGLQQYIVYISDANSTDLGTARYDTVTNTALKYYTFTSTKSGGNFAQDATYRVGVRVADNAGNISGLAYADVVYKRARPASWSWLTPKVASKPFNVTAVEWESLGRAINLFRIYKGYINRDFIVPARGDRVTATIFNQYRNALSDMSPPISPPVTKYTGDKVLASDFNRLVDSLNSIT